LHKNTKEQYEHGFKHDPTCFGIRNHDDPTAPARGAFHRESSTVFGHHSKDHELDIKNEGR